MGKAFELKASGKIVTYFTVGIGLFMHKIGAIFDKKPKKKHSIFQYQTNTLPLAPQRAIQPQMMAPNFSQVHEPSMINQNPLPVYNLNNSLLFSQSNMSIQSHNQNMNQFLSHLQAEPKPKRFNKIQNLPHLQN